MTANRPIAGALLATVVLLPLVAPVAALGEPLRLESPTVRVEIDAKTGGWSLLDKRAGVRWPSQGMASPGTAKGFEGDFRRETADAKSVRLVRSGGAAVVFELVDEGRSLVLRYEGKGIGDLRVLHGFGDPKIAWRGSTPEVRREEVIEVDRSASSTNSRSASNILLIVADDKY